MIANQVSERFLIDKLDEYMSFYDDLCVINEVLSKFRICSNTDDFDLKAYTAATAEKRRISNEMRSILRFLGLKPADVELPSQEQVNEEL